MLGFSFFFLCVYCFTLFYSLWTSEIYLDEWMDGLMDGLLDSSHIYLLTSMKLSSDRNPCNVVLT